MKRKIFICLILNVLVYSFVFSQENSPGSMQPSLFNTQKQSPSQFKNFEDRLYYGGNVGAWFGQTTYINLSPLVGIKITKPFSVGLGVTYNYYSQMYRGVKYSSVIYGGNSFLRYNILENVFLQAGWDRLSISDVNSGIENRRVWIDNILVGGGIRQQFSNRGSYVVAIFYNVNDGPLSPFPNPIVQIGFNIAM